jgi:hypothetical protein
MQQSKAEMTITPVMRFFRLKLFESLIILSPDLLKSLEWIYFNISRSLVQIGKLEGQIRDGPQQIIEYKRFSSLYSANLGLRGTILGAKSDV